MMALVLLHMIKKSTTKKRIVLLDNHAIIHRAYHALLSAELTSPKGEPVGALYGLVTTLLKIITDLKPDYIAACYDLPKPTIRHEAYKEYKGTRTKIDDALARQLQESRKVFDAFSIPMYEREGFEADDLLGTIAHKLRENKNVDVVIASGDMDILQLVIDESVRVYTLKKGIRDTIIYDEKAVISRFGFPPKLIPDYKGLRGDPSDNIKGIPGIGEKTATELIKGFGTIEDIYKILEKSEEPFLKKGTKVRTISLLKEYKEDAVFSKALATIRLDAPIAFALSDKEWNENVDMQKVLTMCDEFGFRSLKNRIQTTLGTYNSSQIKAEFISNQNKLEQQEEDIDDTHFAQAQVMLWLISSEFTNPSLDDILAFTKERTFDSAYAVLEKKINNLGKLKDVYEKIEKPLIPIIWQMEENGVLVNTNALTDFSKKYHIELENIEKKIHKFAGHSFNVSSPKQLAEVLFDEMKIIPERQKKTAGGARSTRESEMEKIKDKHPIVDAVLEYRELRKLLSTYIDNIPAMLGKDNRLHTNFLQTGTTTGRMSSQNPNLQNIPIRSERGKAIRHVFIAQKGFSLVSFDYSQIELRLSAILSKDEKLCEIFKNDRDVHREVAARVFHIAPEKVDAEMRRRAKIINFGILYGMGINALRQQLGTTTAQTHIFYDEYFGQFKTLSEYLESTKGFARTNGYTETLFGRRRQFPEMKSTLPYVRAQAERMAINAPIQGTEADMIKLAMVRVDESLNNDKIISSARLLVQVHDELIYEIRTELVDELSKKIQSIMESVITKKETNQVPIIVSMKAGSDWGSLQSL